MADRRTFLKYGTAAGAGLLAGPLYRAGASFAAESKTGRFFGYVPFTQPLPIPEVLTPLTGAYRLTPAPGRGPGPLHGSFADVAHGIAPEFGRVPDWNRFKTRFSLNDTHEQEYGLYVEETTQRFVPGGPDTPVFTYRDAMKPPGSGRTPGPTIVAEYCSPVVLRAYNALTRNRGPVNTTHHDLETSIHLHGSHSPAHSDGFPDFYCLAGEARDYFHPNIAPRHTDPGTRCAPCASGPFDEGLSPATLWYHDHVMDLTGYTVSHGLAGFYLVIDDKQRELADQGVIPPIGGVDAYGHPLDLGLAIADQRFNADGSLFYDFFDHDGRLGDVFTVNGAVQPQHTVERRKYRLRILNASNARVYELRLSTRRRMHIIGTDSWLLPRAVEVETFQLAQGQRHDVIVDFRDAPDEVYLENILVQEEGRRAEGIDPSKRVPLLKFNVSGPNHTAEPRCADDMPIRGLAGIDPGGQYAPIRQEEVVATRRFEFDRSNGAWTVNNRFFNPRRADATPELGYGAERWLFVNDSGGWWHPIHAHLEGMQVLRVNGRPPRRERRGHCDLVMLEGNFTAEVLIKQRTFTGPFAMHCHAVEHEDMRMMAVIDPTPGAHGTGDHLDSHPALDAERRIDPRISGVMPDCEELEAQGRIYFDEVGDRAILEGRGVGESCEFDRTRRGNRS
jgi:FtsP/CotA-like multicopper oxidase with cupredoxin domain